MNLDSIKPKPTRPNLVDDPFTPLDEIVAGFWMTVLDVRSHYIEKEITHIHIIAIEMVAVSRKRTEIVIVLVLSVNRLCPVLIFTVDAEDSFFATVIIIVDAGKVIEVPLEVALLIISQTLQERKKSVE